MLIFIGFLQTSDKIDPFLSFKLLISFFKTVRYTIFKMIFLTLGWFCYLNLKVKLHQRFLMLS